LATSSAVYSGSLDAAAAAAPAVPPAGFLASASAVVAGPLPSTSRPAAAAAAALAKPHAVGLEPCCCCCCWWWCVLLLSALAHTAAGQTAAVSRRCGTPQPADRAHSLRGWQVCGCGGVTGCGGAAGAGGYGCTARALARGARGAPAAAPCGDSCARHPTTPLLAAIAAGVIRGENGEQDAAGGQERGRSGCGSRFDHCAWPRQLSRRVTDGDACAGASPLFNKQASAGTPPTGLECSPHASLARAALAASGLHRHCPQPSPRAGYTVVVHSSKQPANLNPCVKTPALPCVHSILLHAQHMVARMTANPTRQTASGSRHTTTLALECHQGHPPTHKHMRACRTSRRCQQQQQPRLQRRPARIASPYIHSSHDSRGSAHQTHKSRLPKFPSHSLASSSLWHAALQPMLWRGEGCAQQQHCIQPQHSMQQAAGGSHNTVCDAHKTQGEATS
jgi:hypothetical protein